MVDAGGQTPILLVDAANVVHTDDRFASRPHLTDLALSWAAAAGLVVWLVWDGGGPDVTERTLPDGSRVVASGSQTADTWIERQAAEFARGARPYWLITSDALLRAVAGGAAARQIGSQAFGQVLLEQASHDTTVDDSKRPRDAAPGALHRLLDGETLAKLERLRRGL